MTVKNNDQVNDQNLVTEFFLTVEDVEYPRIYLTNLLYNLVSNSFKYRKKEGPLLLVISSKDLGNGEVGLTYRDNGLGMDLKYFKKYIFKFGNSYHNFENSKGVGLFIVKNQLARLGDSIDLDSKENLFTEFKIKLNLHGKKELGYS